MKTDLVRPYWDSKKLHQDRWKKKDITVLICQRRNLDVIRLCVQSLLRFYPDIPIIIYDGNSNDASLDWAKYMAAKHDNITVAEWGTGDPDQLTPHGEMMHKAMSELIKTKYTLAMDSDTITHRGGWIEAMLEKMALDSNIYAVGTLMLVTKSGEACGDPKGDWDILRYAHPSCSIYDNEKYAELRPMTNHGAPCAYNMISAEVKGYAVAYYPIEEYVSHLCGSSWQKIGTVWTQDYGVQAQPFISFVHDINYPADLSNQTDKDFDCIHPALAVNKEVGLYHVENFRKLVKGRNYLVRFNIAGDYVCAIGSEVLNPEFVKTARKLITDNGYPKEAVLWGYRLVRRDYWQETDSLQ